MQQWIDQRVRAKVRPLKIILFCAVSVLSFQAVAGTITGRASVIDGDTLDIRGQRFRLQGVDTPEGAQMCLDASGKDYPCGRYAALALADKIGVANISCEEILKDRYGRTVAVCKLGSEDLNGWLVFQGLGMAYRKYSVAYVVQEESAKLAKRGIWQGKFIPPWSWRKGERNVPAGQTSQSTKSPNVDALAAVCSIKGNINRKGNRVYHLPGSRDYDRTHISFEAGERMFCSEEEAKSAGWRAPRI